MSKLPDNLVGSGGQLLVLLYDVNESTFPSLTDALDKEMILLLTEVTLNIILGAIPTDENWLAKLRRHGKELHELTDSSMPLSRCIDILKGSGVSKSFCLHLLSTTGAINTSHTCTLIDMEGKGMKFARRYVQLDADEYQKYKARSLETKTKRTTVGSNPSATLNDWRAMASNPLVDEEQKVLDNSIYKHSDLGDIALVCIPYDLALPERGRVSAVDNKRDDNRISICDLRRLLRDDQDPFARRRAEGGGNVS